MKRLAGIITLLLTAVVCSLLCSAPLAAQQEGPKTLTKDEQIEYHQLLEQTRQAQIASLVKQFSAQQQIAAGYQQAAEGLLALLASLQREGSAAAEKSEALEQWKQEKAGRAGCTVQPDRTLNCPDLSSDKAPKTVDGGIPTG